MPSPAFPGMFFCLAAMALLLFASISPPAWDRTYFLKSVVGSSTTIFGVFGECVDGVCTSRSVGYNLMAGGATSTDINPTGLHNLTYILILHPIAGFIALLALLMGFLGICAASRFATIMMAILSFFGAIVTLVAFVIDMVLWSLVKNRIRDAGGSATYGNANWFTIAAFAALCLATCTSFCGAFGRFASGRSAGEKY